MYGFTLSRPPASSIPQAWAANSAGVTTWSPLRKWDVKPGMKVGVIGLGGLGHMALKFSSALGAHTVMITTSPNKASTAHALGADEVLISTDSDAMLSRGTIEAQAALMLASVVLFFVVGLNFGIDFRGGTTIRTESTVAVDVGDYRAAIDPLGLGDVTITEVFDPSFGTDKHVAMIRIQAQEGQEAVAGETVIAVEEALQAIDPGITFPSVESVGPKVSGELVLTAVYAVLAAIGAVLSVFFGAGVVLMTVIQTLPTGRQAGLESFLLGSTAGMLRADAVLIAAGGAATVAFLFVLRRPLALVAFGLKVAWARTHSRRVAPGRP